MIPQEFQERMQKMLGEEYPQFAESYDREKYQSLRLNPLKTDIETFLKNSPFTLKPVPWSEYGYYYDKKEQPGKHPYHEAGVYYIQEPSAMAPAEYLEAKAGERILDLCAAPGGKSTQIAGKMKDGGILICNEIHPARAKILSENIERMGIKNAIVTNETPQKLAETFVEYFDRILVDAPCSGEGMFRKNEAACEEWSIENVQLCATRQAEILDCASSMLKRGGRLVYSTCTFAPEENEGSVSRFIERHPEFSLVKVQKYEGMASGNSVWVEHPAEHIEDTIRLFPHKVEGEGHYLAVLEKAGEKESADCGYVRGGEEQGIRETECKEYLDFQREFLTSELRGIYVRFGDRLYLAPQHTPALKGLKVLRPGLHLGTVKKNRFEPSHALALALSPEEAVHTIRLSVSDREIFAYLNGQTFNCKGEKGWYLVTVEDYSIGWGKLAGTVMKNHYPKGLRKNF